MYYFYVIKSIKTKRCYYGFSENLKERFKVHNQGRSPYTKNGIPWKLIYYEAFANKKDALDRERNIKLRKQTYSLLRKRIKRSIEF